MVLIGKKKSAKWQQKKVIIAEIENLVIPEKSNLKNNGVQAKIPLHAGQLLEISAEF